MDKKGYTFDTDVVRQQSATYEWNGVLYRNKAEAAKVLGVSPSGLSYRISKGYVCDADVRPKKQRKIKSK